MDIQQLLQKAVEINASDMHLIATLPPVYRVNGELQQLASSEPLTHAIIMQFVTSIITPAQRELLENNRSLDFSYGYGGGDYGDRGRFRVNLYYQRGTLAAAFRLLPTKIKTFEELGLPKICHNFANLKQGFVLVTGPTGQGKTTTIASIINEINLTRSANILTIEDPIEYMFPKGRSMISQREIGHDTHSWSESLKSALREDPDVVVIGEMRDPESVASAITIAETGHLVFSTLHTNSASQSIDRIIDSFPEVQQNQIRVQLAATLEGIISQRLIPTIESGRVVATEILIANNAIKANIRDGKTHLIDSIIETSQDSGMYPLEASLAQLVKDGKVAREVALGYALRPESFLRLLESTQ